MRGVRDNARRELTTRLWESIRAQGAVAAPGTWTLKSQTLSFGRSEATF